jgi:hypothetical protein
LSVHGAVNQCLVRLPIVSLLVYWFGGHGIDPRVNVFFFFFRPLVPGEYIFDLYFFLYSVLQTVSYTDRNLIASLSVFPGPTVCVFFCFVTVSRV